MCTYIHTANMRTYTMLTRYTKLAYGVQSLEASDACTLLLLAIVYGSEVLNQHCTSEGKLNAHGSAQQVTFTQQQHFVSMNGMEVVYMYIACEQCCCALVCFMMCASTLLLHCCVTASVKRHTT
jgi:cytosine/uracil/thiamine/allantoin permease